MLAFELAAALSPRRRLCGIVSIGIMRRRELDKICIIRSKRNSIDRNEVDGNDQGKRGNLSSLQRL
jgi:hypothetical protein